MELGIGSLLTGADDDCSLQDYGAWALRKGLQRKQGSVFGVGMGKIQVLTAGKLEGRRKESRIRSRIISFFYTHVPLHTHTVTREAIGLSCGL